VQYARAISEALSVAINLQIEILLPMTDQPGSDVDESMGSLTQLARDDYVGDLRKETARKPDMYGSWDAWNVIRTVCKYNARLFVGKHMEVPICVLCTSNERRRELRLKIPHASQCPTESLLVDHT